MTLGEKAKNIEFVSDRTPTGKPGARFYSSSILLLVRFLCMVYTLAGGGGTEEGHIGGLADGGGAVGKATF